MEILKQIDELLVSWGMSAEWANILDHYVAFVLVLIIAFAADLICRHFLLKAIAKLVRRTKATWDDIVFDHKVMIRMSRIVIPLVVYLLVPVAFADTSSATVILLRRVCLLFIVWTILIFTNSFLQAVYIVYSEQERMRSRPLKGILQTLQVALWFVGGIVILGILLDRSPLALLAGLGASAAVLMLVFKDSIVGFVSGVQLSANNMLKVGDWIKVPKYDADGVVTEVAMNTVKVRNWDNTVTTIPPYALVSDSFQNWNAMRESGGRRIKRSINIDMNSVRFCTPEMVERYRRIRLVRDYIDRVVQAAPSPDGGDNAGLPIDKDSLTNLGIFRAYLTAYLKELPVTNPDLHCMVRHLQPTEHGLPVELYFFSSIKDWIPYEAIQADVFDHVLAIIPEFDLRVFQSPSGLDVRQALNN